MVFNFAELNFPQGFPFLHLIWPQKEHGPDNYLVGETIRKLRALSDLVTNLLCYFTNFGSRDIVIDHSSIPIHSII